MTKENHTPNRGGCFGEKWGAAAGTLKELASRTPRHALTKADIFDSDISLRKVLDDLDEVRVHLKSLWEAVDAHGSAMMAMAGSERVLSQRLSSTASSIVTAAERHLTKERVQAQIALGTAEAQAALAMQKFASDMVDPMRRVYRAFDEKYTGTVVVLRRRYLSQKGDYLKYTRQIAVTEDESKRYNLESLRDASRPIWEKTADALRTEAEKLTIETIKEINHYLVKLSLVRRHTMFKIAENFNDSFEAASQVPL